MEKGRVSMSRQRSLYYVIFDQQFDRGLTMVCTLSY